MGNQTPQINHDIKISDQAKHDEISKGNTAIPILVSGLKESGKSSLVNLFKKQLSSQTQEIQQFNLLGDGLYGIYYKIVLKNQLNIYLFEMKAHGSFNSDLQNNEFYEFLLKLARMCKFVFYLEKQVRNQNPSVEFVKKLFQPNQNQNQNQNLPKMYLLKNSLNQNEMKKEIAFPIENLVSLIKLPFIQSGNFNDERMNSLLMLSSIIVSYIEQNDYQITEKDKFEQDLKQLIDSKNNNNPQNNQNENLNQLNVKVQSNLCSFKKNEESGQFEIVYDKNLIKDFCSEKKTLKTKTIICCGKTGVGKSYFLTQLCKQYGQKDLLFEYDSNPQQKTVGINYHRFENDGYDVIIMDCQGFDFYDSELDEQDQKEFQKQLKFLISMFSKSFQYFLFMQTEMEYSTTLIELMKDMNNEKAIKFVKPHLIVIKNKLNDLQIKDFKKRKDNNFTGIEQEFPLCSFDKEEKENQQYISQVKEIYKYIKKEDISDKKVYSLYELGEYLNLSIDIFNGDIDKELENIQKILALRFTFSQNILQYADQFKKDFENELKEIIKKYSNNFPRSFLFCSQTIFSNSFFNIQMTKLINWFEKESNKWEQEKNSLIQELNFNDNDNKEQIVSKYANLSNVAPHFIKKFQEYSETQDIELIKAIFIMTIGSGLVAGTVTTAVAAAAAAATAASIVGTATEVGVVATVGLSGLAVSALTLGIGTGVFALVTGSYYGIKQFKKYQKNKNMRKRSANLLKDMREKKIVFNNFETLQSNLKVMISENYGECNLIKQWADEISQTFQKDEQALFYLLLSYMLIDSNKDDLETLTKVLEDKKIKFKELFQYTKNQLLTLKEENRLWDIHYDQVYQMNFKGIKKNLIMSDDFVIQSNGQGTVQNLEALKNLTQIPNYGTYGHIYDSLAILRAQSKLFVLQFLFDLLIEPYIFAHSKFIFNNFNTLLIITEELIKQNESK